MAVGKQDFTFFSYLWQFYKENRGRIRNHYKGLTKKILDYNDPENEGSWLRVPQYEALEMYVFLKEYLNNAHLTEIFNEWRDQTGRFEGRARLSLFEQEMEKLSFDKAFKNLQAVKQEYSNYIFALTMGTGKTLLMATCIFYEFLLANKFSKDPRFCQNALIFAPDKTVLQSLREIETFDKSKVIPAEYARQLDTMLKIQFLDDAGLTLNTLDGDMFNLIISNTQKIILKRQQKELAAVDRIFNDDNATLELEDPDFAELIKLADLSEANLTSNQRFKKLSRLPQLGIYVDEAHHALGNKLNNDLYDRKAKTSLRLTIDMLAKNLERQGSHVVACYNFTGTPYAKNKLLPEVVYSYPLRQAIRSEYLKTVGITGFDNAKSKESIKIAIEDFWKTHDGKRYEGMLPKMAFFTSTIEELDTELRPAVEEVLISLGIPTSKILVNVGDDKLTSNDDIREFNRLDTPGSEKQFILLVNKGKEGWNCRSLFAVSMFRKPKSTIFVLQATMRCLRSITDTQQEGNIYLSQENVGILEKELQENFQMSIDDLRSSGNEKIVVTVRPTEPPVKVKLKRRRKKFEINELDPTEVKLNLDDIDLDRYKITQTQKDILHLGKDQTTSVDISHVRENRPYSVLTLVSEIARYLNRTCLKIKQLLSLADTSLSDIVRRVSEHNEILYDFIIPRLFDQIYEMKEFTYDEDQEVTLVNPPKDGEGFSFRVLPELLAKIDDPQFSEVREKTFHLDHYCFDSKPEFNYFKYILDKDEIERVYFTGMLTHGQSDFKVSYIDPESHTLRQYFPDFLIQKKDGKYLIIEIKGDNKLDDPVVQAKKEYAHFLAENSGMTYEVLPSSQYANA